MSLALGISAENYHNSWDYFIIELFSSYCSTVNMLFQEGVYYKLGIIRQVFLKDLVN